MNPQRTLCITLPETPERHQAAAQHFKERGLEVEFVMGIHARTAGLMTSNFYDRDSPSLGFHIPAKHVGLVLSHILCWTLIAHGPDDKVLVLEDDALLEPGWKERLDYTLTVCPDFDILLLGSCNCGDKPKDHIGGSIWRVEGPQCTHGYIVTKQAAKHLISLNRKIYAPIDLMLGETSYPHLKTLVVLPRIIAQRGIHIEH